MLSAVLEESSPNGLLGCWLDVDGEGGIIGLVDVDALLQCVTRGEFAECYCARRKDNTISGVNVGIRGAREPLIAFVN